MLKNIPTHVIAGPLGAGKTSLLRRLLDQRPHSERWAVLINEFGQIGLDAALLSGDRSGVQIAEVAGGCLCCVNGVPFQVGLGKLLRSVRPHRLFIEPSGLGHPVQLLQHLQQAPWAGVLAVQPLLMVLDAQSLARGEPLAEVQRQALANAGSVVINKAASVDQSERLLITSKMPEIDSLWTDFGRVDLARLKLAPVTLFDELDEQTEAVDISTPQGTLWTDPTRPLCQTAVGEGGWSIGWRWHPGQSFDAEKIADALAMLPWRRAKGVIHSALGWRSFNGLAPGGVEWRDSEWRNDSRIELIFDQPQDTERLAGVFATCQVTG
ncbi:CobW family GTP-binding protein [Pseudomonas cremoricolorata]|uniref:Cobalamin biosynthesis protein CobW n=1 Tax=Pseudomonas cremoricolorata TaxID=157783 RepID=A0A089WNU3_9PSED|nr:CobW-like GTP-binding protein [Pseudomonas cremoricolorata]AIR88814.1 cobalamin biosynthesis protein CobW [Pseudomonas cremoricolorata]